METAQTAATHSAVIATRHDTVTIRETGEVRPKASPDQIMVTGVLESTATASIHTRAPGLPRRHGN